jgi:hypothetical protein
MKFLKYAVAIAAALVYGQAYAFHSGGVAECEGCHSMHNSFEGSANVGRSITGGGFQVWRAYGTGSGANLLKATEQSGACLNCHEPNPADTAPSSYHISTIGVTPGGVDPIEMTPGGDFSWLKKTMTYTVRGSVNTNEGDRHGHNINAADFGYNTDGTNLFAPNAVSMNSGYPAANLHCSSCHDPHGRYRRDASGNIATTGLPIFNSGSYSTSAPPVAGIAAVGVYRILGGIGYQPKSLAGSWAFVNPPPAAVAPSTYNRAEYSGASSAQTHVAYGSGMSEWCANCHPGMHNDTTWTGNAPAGSVHPAGNGAKLGATIAANYNTYVSSGIMTNTDNTKAYSTLAPFESGNGQTLNDYTTMKALAINTDTKDQSAQATSNVMCLSCHRAHASAWESMVRYNLGNEFMTIADTATNAAVYADTNSNAAVSQGYSTTQAQTAYYGRPATVFGPYARNYCNKCHAKD